MIWGEGIPLVDPVEDHQRDPHNVPVHRSRNEAAEHGKQDTDRVDQPHGWIPPLILLDLPLLLSRHDVHNRLLTEIESLRSGANGSKVCQQSRMTDVTRG